MTPKIKHQATNVLSIETRKNTRSKNSNFGPGLRKTKKKRNNLKLGVMKHLLDLTREPNWSQCLL